MKLPQLAKKIDTDLQKNETSKDREHQLRLQKFTGYLNTPVEKEKLENHPVIKGVKYLPISYTEMALDRIFLGLWETANFRIEVILNEVAGIIDLWVFHPVEKVWICRTGTAAVRIMTDSPPDGLDRKARNEWALDTSNKKPEALGMGGLGTLKAEYFKNAVQSLGAYFGREVNRKISEQFNGLIKDVEANIKKLRKELSDGIGLIQDEAERQALINAILEAESSGKNTAEFYQSKLDLLNN